MALSDTRKSMLDLIGLSTMIVSLGSRRLKCTRLARPCMHVALQSSWKSIRADGMSVFRWKSSVGEIVKYEWFTIPSNGTA